ncbi:MAG: hypothetical protein N4J56_007034 [Chroococcidiopsis sp. SAG 2025]|uniref:DUF1822 family protein n=1 Tax=Chroococcidiopsis sp. SAG 2025 TaxID=171389 RepID=UPI0029373CF0|nr:DUF1822 family protein [Chroococcidiopsis sp. SAG 2025]MDV2997329.1 hypothetical protein [Chroococcidiopsis sp. SAG 2025]
MLSLSNFANIGTEHIWLLSLLDFANIDTEHTWLQLDIAKQEEAWQLSRHHSNPIARYNAYLNRVCLSHLLNWVQEWLPEESGLRAQVFPSEQSLPSILEVVNGTAIKVGETRIVLVPTETIDIEELRVPQEWVDINSWAADYYILVQIDLDEDDDSSLRLCGFTTHLQLKNQGKYNQSDRTYSLPMEQLTEDFTLLFATLGVNWQKQVPQGVTLSSAEAQNLVQTLGDPSVYSPRLRLDVPFAQWAALLEHGGWRQRLYEQRQRLPEQWSVLEWLQTGISDFARELGWMLVSVRPNWSGAREANLTPALALPVLIRRLEIAGQQYLLQVSPIGSIEQRIWRFELRNATEGGKIPGGMKLRLLTEELQTFLNNEAVAATAVDQLCVEVKLEPGEGLVWEIEPIPENYTQEIWWF